MTAASPGSPDDPGTTAAEIPHRCPDPTRMPPPIARAHPTRRSYDNSSLGPPTSCGSTGQDHPVGNPRSHVSGGPSPPYRLGHTQLPSRDKASLPLVERTYSVSLVRRSTTKLASLLGWEAVTAIKEESAVDRRCT